MTFIIVACTSEKKVVLGEDFLKKAHTSVKEAYGENYLPRMPINEDVLAKVYGIPMNLVKEDIAEGPMMSAHVDTFIGLKVKEDKDAVNQVANALRSYHSELVNNSLQYPANMAKVKAAKVLVIENYVFFLMLGKINDKEGLTEEERLEFAQEQVQIGVKAIEDLVK
ncbi:DUF4358 domain-containing protein [Orenia marismortui]|uniref:DUF4358 domain-containing protein n=1 Tax=Orenia marismortui TaxID=46469 RepID=UPI0014617032|nr:DUF4358 domain-containing protein [Orenia marismortui]